MSNEASAGEGNVVYDGVEINHQYSKSLDFERRLSRHVTTSISSELEVFSLLRPLGELAIARLFSDDLRRKYAGSWSSCNRNFRSDARGLSWCGECSKCAFVYLILAPFVPRDNLAGLIGGDMFLKPELRATYDELLGLSGHKPFECVGEIDECRLAMGLAAASGSYPEAKQWAVPFGAPDFSSLGVANMPPRYREMLKRYVATHGSALLSPEL
jgi:hypothetical protein